MSDQNATPSSGEPPEPSLQEEALANAEMEAAREAATAVAHASTGEPVDTTGDGPRVRKAGQARRRAAKPAAEPGASDVPAGEALSAASPQPGATAGLNAEVVELRQGAMGMVSARDVTVSLGAIGGVRAESVSVQRGLVGGIVAGRVSFEQGGAANVLAREVVVHQGGARTIVGNTVHIEQGGAVSVIGNQVSISQGGAGVVVALRAEGDVRTLFDWRGAVAFGVVAGLLVGLLRRRRRS